MILGNGQSRVCKFDAQTIVKRSSKDTINHTTMQELEDASHTGSNSFLIILLELVRKKGPRRLT
jgi:hypothetical protein